MTIEPTDTGTKESAPPQGDDTNTTLIDDAMIPPKEAVAISYDELKFQDGFTPEEVQAKKDLFKGLGLSQEAATKWLEDTENATKTAAQRAIEEHIEKLKSEWSARQEKNREEIKKAFGDKLTEKMGSVVAAIDKFLPKEDAESFKKLQRESGLGNNPAFIKFMANIGELVADGKINPSIQINDGKENFLSNLYANSNY